MSYTKLRSHCLRPHDVSTTVPSGRVEGIGGHAVADHHSEEFPGKWLVYNLSPSFNWSWHGFN
ncbi:unnamed protein product, partial [Tilletia controversa]